MQQESVNSIDHFIEGVHLRAESDKDRSFLFHLYASTRENEISLFGWNEQQKSQFLNQQFNAQHNYYRSQFKNARFNIIYNNNNRIGRFYINHSDAEIQIIDISLISDERNKGFGTQLIHLIIEEAKQKHKPIRLHVELHNPAVHLYTRLGFKEQCNNGVYRLMECLPN